MSDAEREKERERLAEADRHVAEAEEQIAMQEGRIAREGRSCEHRAQSERLLAGLRQSLDVMNHHRRLIVEALERDGETGAQARGPMGS